MRKYYGYTRVSTVKQGEKGSSLAEQKDAILRYASKHNITISDWFEEMETAAKRGRTVFRRMLNSLKKGHAHGLVMHKVDRGARNLADWAELAALMDIGVDVHFAHEAIDLSSRGGRLSADIQAVVAADYIRNLREEVKKGIYGRLKQGMYPFGAPAGYKNNGKGQIKTIDPIQAPLVREAFELYANGEYPLHALLSHMTAKGLRNSAGNAFTISGLAVMLKSPFYYGMIIVQGQSFLGRHEPLISKDLFDKVRARAEGRLYPRNRRPSEKEYAFRRLLKCKNCHRSLYGEEQKGHIYYRCQTKSCAGTCVKEEDIVHFMRLPLSYIHIPPTLKNDFEKRLELAEQNRNTSQSYVAKSLKLRLSQIDAKERKLTDLLIDEVIDRETYNSRKIEIQNDRISIAEQIEKSDNCDLNTQKVKHFLELVKGLQNMDIWDDCHKIRDFTKNSISNLEIDRKIIEISWSNPFLVLFDIGGFPIGAPERYDSRKCSALVTQDKQSTYSNVIYLEQAKKEKEFANQLKTKGDKLFEAALACELLQPTSEQMDDFVPSKRMKRLRRFLDRL